MSEYYVIRDKNTGLYFRGKGVNRWGKYFNQASIYRTKVNAEKTINEVAWHDEQTEIVPIQIIESAKEEEVRHGEWIDNGIQDSMLSKCSVCGFPWGACTFKRCPECGAKMDGGKQNDKREA